MCDVDERWNGPPPRCDPIFCDEPATIRNGGFSLSTNSTVVGTLAAYYCTSPRHVLVGVPKLTCRKDGSWDAPFPECRSREVKPGLRPQDQVPLPSLNRPGQPFDRESPILGRRPIRKNSIPLRPQQGKITSGKKTDLADTFLTYVF
jgi:hypothetical protein